MNELIKKVYIVPVIALVLAAGIAAGSAWSGRKAAALERGTEAAKQRADSLEADAARHERLAAEYKAKIEYLDARINDISAEARKQDEELRKIETDADAARGRVERARRLRSIGSSAEELCRKLAELGHPCG